MRYLLMQVASGVILLASAVLLWREAQTCHYRIGRNHAGRFLRAARLRH